MKNTVPRVLVLTLSCAVILGFATRAQAAPADLLRKAYHSLELADHDYKGHRIDAMHDIEKAGKELGIDLKGDGHDKEKQGMSDEHLREAQNLLHEAASGLSGKPLKHVKAAEHQLKVALGIK